MLNSDLKFLIKVIPSTSLARIGFPGTGTPNNSGMILTRLEGDSSTMTKGQISTKSGSGIQYSITWAPDYLNEVRITNLVNP